MRFEKVSLVEFKAECNKIFPEMDDTAIETTWNNITLPRRATYGSAGYDMYSPFDMNITGTAGEYAAIPTGIRMLLDGGFFAMIVPRSGLGFKYGMRLANTVGIIDSDYQNADNEGHVMVKFTAEKPFEIKAGDRFAQAIILPYFNVYNDEPIEDERVGGIGSTGGAE